MAKDLGTESQYLRNIPKQWNIGPLQLLVHRYLAIVQDEKSSIFRIISEDDAYAKQVKLLMEAAGIKGIIFKGQFLVSTTGLLKIFGRDKLLKAKQAHFSKV